eukprot:TRINITY_DN4173_c2_g2_i1.p1 TRINITY_DN4173_c2_g2~~TRINITY_DN4173_c2_g2_i1.p1  ORF type:complete len:293 (+),score=35.85 TRINITY_DN4173_c2_g2_i1:28-906(+)
MFPMDPGLSGFWSPHTATVNWCEHDYAVHNIVAEWHNTWSNLAFIAFPALTGLYRCLAERAERRFVACYSLLLVVGLGSTWFHATLRWEGQLCDELPMLWINAVFIFCLIERGSGGVSGPGEQSLLLQAALGMYCIAATSIYVFLAWYEIFFICYGVGVVYLVVACWRVSFRGALADGNGGNLLRDMCTRAFLFYGFGFVLWSFDNHSAGCAMRHALQAHLAGGSIPALAILCELHMWWHFGAGTGTYCFIVWLQVLRGLKTGQGPRVRWGTLGLLPYVVLEPESGLAKKKA